MSPTVHKIFEILENAVGDMNPTMVASLIKEFGNDPYIVLISCLLSLRARDTVTYPICRKLFLQAKTPQEMLGLSQNYLQELFYPIGFYRKKAQLIHEVSTELINRFGGRVPHTEKELRSIKGVGHKTAALVLAEGFGIPAICVDTHVHRLSNRIGLVKTKTPQQTEKELKKILPKAYWNKVNRLFVVWGQNICTPIAPYCKTKCAIKNLCPKIGVTKMR